MVSLLALAACGSSSRHNAGVAASNPAVATAKLASVKVPSNAPAYCKTLAASGAFRGLGGAMAALAANANDTSAHTTVQQAAIAVRASAAQAPAGSRSVLLAAAAALTQLDQRGVSAAADVNSALQNAGQTLEQPCAFPVS